MRHNLKKLLPLILIFVFLFAILLFSMYWHSNPANTKSSSKNTNGEESEITSITQLSVPKTLSKPGYYRITTDLAPTDVYRATSNYCTVFRITSSDVVIDGMGHTVDGSQATPPCTSIGAFSIRDTGSKFSFSHVTIKNMTLLNFDNPVAAHSVRDFHVENMTITTGGISLYTSSEVFIVNNNFTNINEDGIFGRDNEKVTIENNRIANTKGSGMSLDGRQFVQMIPPQIEIPSEIDVFRIDKVKMPLSLVNLSITVKRKTSGNGYSITHNSIENAGRNGISLNLINHFKITDNTITGCKGDGVRCQNCGPDHEISNNTRSGNGREEFFLPSGRWVFPWSTVLGLLLLLLFSGVFNIAQKVAQNKFLGYIWGKYLWLENSIRSWILERRISLLLEGLLAVSFIGLVIFGLANAFKTLPEFDVQSVIIIMIISGIVTVIPIAVQDIVAIRKKLVTEYRLWWGGIYVIIITVLPLFTAIFGKPIRMVIQNETTANKREIFITKLVGPLTAIFLSIVFILLYAYDILSPYSLTGMQMCLLVSVVMLLPVSPMEGATIWQNKILWALLFFPVLIAYFISILLQSTIFIF